MRIILVSGAKKASDKAKDFNSGVMAANMKATGRMTWLMAMAV